MIETVVSVKLPIGETLRIKKNSLTPDNLTGNEQRICLISGIYGDELGGQYICAEVIKRIKDNFSMLTGIVDVYPAINPLGLDARTRVVPTRTWITAQCFRETYVEEWKNIRLRSLWKI